MIEYRKLPKGEERLSALGLGAGSLQNADYAEIRATVEKAIANGINFFDLCAGSGSVYEPFGDAIKPCRKDVHFQLHFGAVYDENGEYGWSRNPGEIKRTFEKELTKLKTDYVDFGFLHCVDELSDFAEIEKNGILDFVLSLKEQGVVKHVGFSSHTPEVANAVLDTGIADMMMFSLNPAYDLEKGDEYGIGSTAERANLLRRLEAEKVGVSVMKPFHGGQLLDAKTSPFHRALTKNQCIRYALDRPAVLSVVPGVRGLSDLDELLTFLTATDEEQDYSAIGEFTPEAAVGNCVYCNHCLPCPKGIDIGLVNKYYDLSMAGDKMAHNHYDKLKIKADACIGCGHCDKRCPFKVKQKQKMKTIANYFKGENLL